MILLNRWSEVITKQKIQCFVGVLHAQKITHYVLLQIGSPAELGNMVKNRSENLSMRLIHLTQLSNLQQIGQKKKLKLP